MELSQRPKEIPLMEKVMSVCIFKILHLAHLNFFASKINFIYVHGYIGFQEHPTGDKFISLLLFSTSSEIETLPLCLTNLATASNSSCDI